MVRHRQVQVDGIELHVAEAGSGPPVVLVHGFPELWYSWRHQLPVLADAGYRAVALDLRGYGTSSAPVELDAYDLLTVCGDLVGLLDDLDSQQAVVVGHDWGAIIAWELARLHPERVAAVMGMSVPFVPRPPAPPVELLRQALGDDFYIVWFQQPGVADAALARNVRRTLTTTKPWGPRWVEGDDVPARPAWMTEADLAVYVDAFERTGFTGALNYDRNLDRNWQLTARYADRTIKQPAIFLTGSRDPVRTWLPDSVMGDWVTDLRERVVIDGAGHWIQQERPAEVNAALLRFLSAIGY